jgi:S1-C subfamily serine protease
MFYVLDNKGNAIPIGSGFIASRDGLLVTANHVANKDIPIRCKLPDGKDCRFSVLKRNELQDFAILKIEQPKKNFKYLKIGDYSSVHEGDEILFSGFPLHLPFVTIQRGMISSKYHAKFASLNYTGDWLQIDGSINKGSSGGPVINIKDGRVIGIVNFMPAGIGEKLKKLRDGIHKQQESGTNATLKIAGDVDLADSIIELINILESTMSVGMGHSISINHIKKELDMFRTTAKVTR